MKIAVAADHRGYAVKERIVVLLNEQGHQVVDMGTNSAMSCDYPDCAYGPAKAVAETVGTGVPVRQGWPRIAWKGRSWFAAAESA